MIAKILAIAVATLSMHMSHRVHRHRVCSETIVTVIGATQQPPITWTCKVR